MQTLFSTTPASPIQVKHPVTADQFGRMWEAVYGYRPMLRAGGGSRYTLYVSIDADGGLERDDRALDHVPGRPFPVVRQRHVLAVVPGLFDGETLEPFGA